MHTKPITEIKSWGMVEVEEKTVETGQWVHIWNKYGKIFKGYVTDVGVYTSYIQVYGGPNIEYIKDRRAVNNEDIDVLPLDIELYPDGLKVLIELSLATKDREWFEQLTKKLVY